MIVYIYAVLDKDDHLVRLLFESTDENAIEHFTNTIVPIVSIPLWLYLVGSYDDVFTQFNSMLKVMLSSSDRINSLKVRRP